MGIGHATDREIRLLRLPVVGFVTRDRFLEVGVVALVFLGVTTVVALLPLTPAFVRFVVLLTAASVAASFVGLFLVVRERVTVTVDGPVVRARDEASGLVRHGSTFEEALSELEAALDDRSAGAAPRR